MQLPPLPSFLTKKILIMGGAAALVLILGSLSGYFFLKHKLERDHAASHVHSHEAVKEDAHEGEHEDKKILSEEEILEKEESLKPMIEISPDALCVTPAMNFLTIIVTDLGLSENITDMAIRDLPREVVLSFSPYTKMINQWSLPAKTSGHQMLMQLHSEKSLEDLDLLTYFDGVLLMPVEEAEKSPFQLDNFILTLQEKEKIILDGRLIMESALDKQALKNKTPIIKINGQITADNIVLDKAKCLEQKGFIMVDAALVPYLVEQFEKHPDIKLSPLKTGGEKK